MALRTGLASAALLSTAFLIGIQWGSEGLAWGWLAGMAAALAIAIELSLPVIRISRRALLGAVAPGLATSGVMAAIVWAADLALPAMGSGSRLALLVAIGIAAYGALLVIFERPVVDEVRGLLEK
jgi:hypothetical protein